MPPISGVGVDSGVGESVVVGVMVGVKVDVGVEEAVKVRVSAGAVGELPTGTCWQAVRRMISMSNGINFFMTDSFKDFTLPFTTSEIQRAGISLA